MEKIIILFVYNEKHKVILAKNGGLIQMRVRKKEIGTSNIVGKRIEQRRKAIGMKQKDLLAQIQIRGIEMNASGLSKVEGQIRHVNDYELVAFADILGVSMNWLVGLE